MFSPSTSLRFDLLVEPLVPERGNRGAAVRRVFGVGDRDAFDARGVEDGEAAATGRFRSRCRVHNTIRPAAYSYRLPGTVRRAASRCRG